MKYAKRICVDLPKPILDDLDRLVAKDGRKRAEILRSLIVNAARESKSVHSGGAPRVDR